MYMNRTYVRLFGAPKCRLVSTVRWQRNIGLLPAAPLCPQDSFVFDVPVLADPVAMRSWKAQPGKQFHMSVSVNSGFYFW